MRLAARAREPRIAGTDAFIARQDAGFRAWQRSRAAWSFSRIGSHRQACTAELAELFDAGQDPLDLRL